MKRYVLFFLAWASTLSLFAEDPRYFRELYDENAPLEQRYNYLLGKRISVEKKIAFFYDKSIQAYKHNSSVWDLEAKLQLLYALKQKVFSFLGKRSREEWDLDRIQGLEMQAELFRDIFGEYLPDGQKELEERLRERIREYLNLRTQESHKHYLEAMFARDRNRFIDGNVREYDFIHGLVETLRNDPVRMLDLYDRSLIRKRLGRSLSKYVRIKHPWEEQLAPQLEALEKEREVAASAAKKLSDVADMSATKEDAATPTSLVAAASSNPIRLRYFFAAIAVIFPLAGLFLWLKIRSRNSRAPRKN